jgi:hypothetical protein
MPVGSAAQPEEVNVGLHPCVTWNHLYTVDIDPRLDSPLWRRGRLFPKAGFCGRIRRESGRLTGVFESELSAPPVPTNEQSSGAIPPLSDSVPN